MFKLTGPALKMKIFSCFACLISRHNNKGNPKPLPPRTHDERNTTSYNKSLDHKTGPSDNGSTNRVQERAVESLKGKEIVKEITDCSENGYDDDDDEGGHFDPSLGRATAWMASPKLKGSCSKLSNFTGHDQFHCSYPRPLYDLRETVPLSNESVNSNKEMLKKHPSMQILPSGSRRLRWKLFLESRRNLHKHIVSLKTQPLGVSDKNHKSGYASDFADYDHSSHEVKTCTGFTNQWIAFSAESSSMKRVDEWVRGLETETLVPVNEDEDIQSFVASPKIERSHSRNVSEAIVHANSLIQSLSKSSSVAHISSIGLKAIPSISHFTSLKSIDLSNNFIVQIAPASLPKSLQVLNLSKNKISVIEGLRDLTRLRVLNLSYNRITHIGKGLSNCTLIKELDLAGNKIGNVEGLHRLLKLSVLDLSFNKISTTKAIGQLVANYNSLVALNILGNPIQSNVGEDQLRKTVSSLLPKLVYLNKELTRPQRGRKVLKDSFARAAFGGGDSLHHHRRKRRSTKRVIGLGSPSAHHRSHMDPKTSQHQLRKTWVAEIQSY